MEKEIVYYGQEDSLLELFNKSMESVPAEDGPSIVGFQIVLGVRHNNVGQTVRFWDSVPDDVLKDAESWDPFSTLFKQKYCMRIFLKFRSEKFLSDPQKIHLFIYEWSAAFQHQEKEQHRTVRDILSLHPVAGITCVRDQSGTVLMRMDFSLIKPFSASFHSLGIASQ